MVQFEDSDLEDSSSDQRDPTLPSLEAIVEAGHAFSIPWSHNVRPLLSGFQSELIVGDASPWLLQSPFDMADLGLGLTTVLFDKGSVIGTYHDSMSTSTSSSTDHLSVAGGVTIGYSFLNASVSGQYDKKVNANSDSIRASGNASCRVGRIVLEGTPVLSKAAVDILSGQNGAQRFRRLYGDFYVCGYELGADAGASLSASTSSTQTSEKLKVTVAVKVLFVKVSKSFTKESYSGSSSASLTLYGYNTLEGSMESLSNCKSFSEQNRLQLAASSYLTKVSSLLSDVEAQVARLQLSNGQILPFGKCAGLCSSGLVVELLLAPFARLNQYVEAREGTARLQVWPYALQFPT